MPVLPWVRTVFVMTSKAALAFDRTAHTTAALKKFWKDDPIEAAKWTVGVVKSAGADAKAIDQLERVLKGKGTAEQKAERLKKLITEQPDLLKLTNAKAMADVQQAGKTSLSWEASDKAEPMRITGRPVIENGIVKFKTTHGTFDLDMASTWREEIETTFLNDVITVKGAVQANGTTLKVDQWGPGTGPFMSGRVQIEGDDVYISPTGSIDEQSAKVTNPELKRILMNKGPDTDWSAWNPVGVLLPSEPVKNRNGKLEYRDFPKEGFYVLGRLMKLDIQKLPGGKVVHLADTGFFKKTAAFGPKDVPIPKNSKPGAWPFAENDGTTGSTEKGMTGPRVFFHAKPVASDTTVPGLDLTGGEPPFTRALEISWVSKPADVGTRGITTWPPPPVEPDLGKRIALVAKATPAAQPTMNAEEATFVPENRVTK